MFGTFTGYLTDFFKIDLNLFVYQQVQTMYRPKLIRSTNGSDNDRALAAYVASIADVELNIQYRKSIALSTLILHTSPCLIAFNLLKQAFHKLKPFP